MDEVIEHIGGRPDRMSSCFVGQPGFAGGKNRAEIGFDKNDPLCLQAWRQVRHVRSQEANTGLEAGIPLSA